MSRLGRPNVGRILVERQTITAEQLNAALQYQAASGGRMGEVLVRLGYCTDAAIARSLAEQVGFPFIDLEETPPHPSAVFLLPGDVAEEFCVIPVRMEENRLLVAAREPYDIRVDDAVERATRCRIQLGLAPESQLLRALKKYYDRDVWH